MGRIKKTNRKGSMEKKVEVKNSKSYIFFFLKKDKSRKGELALHTRKQPQLLQVSKYAEDCNECLLDLHIFVCVICY